MTLLVCERCDTVHSLRDDAPKEAPHCIRCGTTLYRAHPLRINTMLSLTITGLIAFVIANAYPIVELDAHGQRRAATLLQSALAAADHHGVTVAVVCLVAAFVLPALELFLCAWVLVPLRRDHVPLAFSQAMRVLRAIRAWSMIEVFLLAVVVSAVKLGGMADVTPQVGVFAFGVVTVMLTALRMFDLRDIWARAEAIHP